MKATPRTIPADGDVIGFGGARYLVSDYSGRLYRGKPLPANWVGLHRWVQTRQAYTSAPSFFRDATKLSDEGAIVIVRDDAGV